MHPRQWRRAQWAGSFWEYRAAQGCQARPEEAQEPSWHFDHAAMRLCMRDLKPRRPISSEGDRSQDGGLSVLNARLKAAEGAYSSTLTMCSV